MNTSIPGDKPRSHFNLPNTLTWLRILMIPGVVVLYYLPFWWADPAAALLRSLNQKDGGRGCVLSEWRSELPTLEPAGSPRTPRRSCSS